MSKAKAKTITTTTMIPAHSLLVLLPLVFISNLHPTTATATSSSSSTDFIRASCGATRYPALCIQSLSAYAPAVRRSPRQLAHAALSVSADRARAASAFVSRVASSASRSREAGAVRDCMETMADSVDRLRNSMQEMGHMGRAGSSDFSWHLSNVQTWVSAALTDENTCLDELPKGAGVRASIRKKVVGVAQVTSNALALVNRIG